MLTIEPVSEFSMAGGEVYSLDYEALSGGLHHRKKYIDYESRIIRDPLDDKCRLYVAVEDGQGRHNSVKRCRRHRS
jgi:hypothetical protein